MRNLIIILGDQLDSQSSALDGLDVGVDRIWMAEVEEESKHVWSHKARTVFFLAAMRHFAAVLTKRSWHCDYVKLDDPKNTQSLAGELQRAIRARRPQKVILTQPGDWRVQQALTTCAADEGVPLEIREDRHFYCSLEGFRSWATGRKQLRLEYFYREMRKRHGILMKDGKPEGGEWNFDAENRGTFGRSGPKHVPKTLSFPPDRVTRDVIALVESRFGGHPGRLDKFDFPVTTQQAESALDDFIRERLPDFGRYQDAMWVDEPYLYHSRLSAAMNVKLLPARRVVEAVEAAYRRGDAPLAAAEGFIRQILGWREYVRGIYWNDMPAYADSNALDAHEPLPGFYWTAETPMSCLRDAIGQTLSYGYAHHIQRLMVTGLYALLLGVEPRQVHEWYLAVYVDAIEWVELPNTIGMSQYADGGRMASKPYAATGKYIQRMSNYCERCAFDPSKATGADACPFTTLYWDFLMRNETRLRQTPRMELQLRNLSRLDEPKRLAIRQRAAQVRSGLIPASTLLS